MERIEIRYSWPGVSVATVQAPPGESRMSFATHEIGFVLDPVVGHEAWVDAGPPREFPLVPGMGWIVPSGCAGYGLWRQPVRWLEVSLEPWRLESMFPRGFGPEAIALQAKIEFVDELLVRLGLGLHAAAAGDTDTETIYRDALLAGFTAHLVRTWSNATDVERGAPRRTGMRRVLDYIEDNLQAELALDELAGIAHLSRFHFARVFKAETGRAPHAYIVERRLHRAKRLLADTRLSSSEIGHRCGFASLSHFSERLRRQTGRTPGQFRAEMD